MSEGWRDTISPAERAAIAAYDGPVTVCPARTFTQVEPDPKASLGDRKQRARVALKEYYDKLRAERRSRMVQMLKSGLSVTDIAAKLGRQPSSVIFSIKQLGLNDMLDTRKKSRL